MNSIVFYQILHILPSNRYYYLLVQNCKYEIWLFILASYFTRYYVIDHENASSIYIFYLNKHTISMALFE